MEIEESASPRLCAADPSAPSFAGVVDLPRESWAVLAFADIALVANWDGVIAVDVSDPASPMALGTLGVAGRPQDLHRDGNRMYVASGTAFQVLDITNIRAPALLGELTPGTQLNEVWAPSGGPAYVVDKNARTLLTIDVSVVPPRVVHETDPDPMLDLRAVAGSGGTLVVGVGVAGVGAVRTYDISGATPILLSEAPTTERVFEVAVVNDVVYAATNTGGVESFSLVACP